MINVSNAFKRAMITNRNFKNYADVTLANGLQLQLTPSDFMVGGCSITDATTTGNSFEVGAVVGKIATVILANHNNKFSGYDFYGAIFWLYISLELEDGSVEKVRKGKFTVIEPETPGDTITITMVDDVYKLDRPYTANTVYPSTAQQVLSDCCLDCGIPVGFTQLPNYTPITNRPDKVTYRNVFSWVCQVIGYNARIDINGYMQLVWYDFGTDTEDYLNGGVFDGGNPYLTGDSADGGNFKDYKSGDSYDGGSFLDDNTVLKSNKSVTVSTDNVIITGVKITNGEEEFLYGTDEYVINLKDNPFTEGKQSIVGNYLGQRIVNTKFRPFAAQIPCNPLYEAYDTCEVVDRKGNVYVTLMNHIQFKVGSYTSVSCKADPPVKNGSEYFSPAANAVVQARKFTNNSLTVYDKAVQNMNSIVANMFGYFETYEDTSNGRITYSHDKPELKDSKIIYKRGIDGFFVSQDGGKSYTAGFDSSGNAVLNILYAIGIVADWIKGGTLTLGGMNNQAGKFYLLDAEGKVNIVQDNEGITFYYDYSENGGLVKRGFKITKGEIDGNGFITASIIKATTYLNANLVTTPLLSADDVTVKKTLTSNGTLVVKGATTLETLTTNKNASLASASITGQASMGSLYVTGTGYISGKLTLGNGASISGEVTLSSGKLIALSGASISGLSVSSGATISGGLKVSNGGIDVTGSSEMYATTFKGNVYINYGNTLYASGPVNISGLTSFTNNVSLTSTSSLTANGPVTVGGKLSTNGDCAFGLSYSNLGFFGSSGSGRKSVSTLYSPSSATTSEIASKVNEIINALKAYNLFY